VRTRGFDTVLIARTTINPRPAEEILEAWTAAAAAAAVTGASSS